MPLGLIIALIIGLGGGGVSVAAQGSLPGDALFPVKVHVNEAVENLFTVTDQGQAELNIKFTDRRLSEAEKLAVEGRLSSTTQAMINGLLDQHIAEAQKRITKVNLGNMIAAANLNAEMGATIEAHHKILSDIDVSNSGEDDHDALLAFSIRLDDARGIASSTDEEIGAKLAALNGVGMQEASVNKRAAAQNKIDEVTKYLSKQGVDITASSTSAVAVQITAAQDAIILGDTKATAGLYSEAFISYQKALRLAQEAKHLGDAEGDLKIKIEEREDEEEDHGDGLSIGFMGTSTIVVGRENDDDKGGKSEASENASGSLRVKGSDDQSGEDKGNSGNDNGKDEGGEDGIRVDTQGQINIGL